MSPALYRLNYSQDDVRLQGVLLPVRHADNLVFTLDFPEGFDPGVMRQALRHLFERNDCLRLRFIHKGLSVRQLFSPEATLPPIPEIRFETTEAEEAYLRRFQDSSLDLFRGETLQPVFAVHPDGSAFLIFKTSHYVADLHGIRVLVSDLTDVYRALRTGDPLPPPPASFEAVLRKDEARKTDRARRRANRGFFRDYFARRQALRPRCCGPVVPAGRKSFFQPVDFAHQQMLTCTCPVPADTFAAIRAFCDAGGYSLSTVLMYLSALCTSLLNGRQTHQTLLPFIDGRATLTERRCAGTKVVCPITRADVDYGRPFRENLHVLRTDLAEVYRHVDYPFMGAELLLHRRWCYPLASFIHSFCFSYLAADPLPDGVRFQMVPAPKGAMHYYIIARHDTAGDTLSLVFHVRKRLASPEQLSRFRDLFVRVAGEVLSRPDTALDQVLRHEITPA